MLPKDPFWVTLTEPESPSKVTGLHINIFDSNLLLCTMLHSAPVSKITSVGDNGLYVCNFGYQHVFVSAVSEILPIFCPGRALGNDFLWSTSVVTMDYTWQELSQGHILAYDNTADSFSISHPGGLSIFSRRDNGLYVCNFRYPHVFVSTVSEILPIFCPGRALGNDFLWSTSVHLELPISKFVMLKSQTFFCY